MNRVPLPATIPSEENAAGHLRVQREREVLSVNSAEDQPVAPEQLAVRLQGGCQSSFALLVERFEGRILNYLFQFARNRHDAEDLTQDTFLKVYRNIGGYDPSYPFSTWLFTIAKRTALNHLRSTARSPLNQWEEAGVDGEDPAVLLDRKDQEVSIWKTARTLKPNQYEALWLRYGEGFSIEETARVMNTNRIHVKVLLHRARSGLAKKLRLSLPSEHEFIV